MNKRLILLEYMPGLGGHFTSFILGLSNKVWPFLPVDVHSIQNVDKKELYSFRGLREKYSYWWAFHEKFEERELKTEFVKFMHKSNKQYTTYVLCVHAHHWYYNKPYYKKSVDVFKNRNVSIEFAQMTLSQNYYPLINSFNSDVNLAQLENVKPISDKFSQEYNPFSINFDKFIEREDSFINEYIRIATHFNLDYNVDDAISLYRDWYIERDFKKYLNQLNDQD